MRCLLHSVKLHIVKLRVFAYSETCIYSVHEKVLKASDIVWFLRRQWSQLRKQKDATGGRTKSTWKYTM